MNPSYYLRNIGKRSISDPVAFGTIPSMPHAQILCLGIAFRDTRSYLFAFSNTSADYVCKPSRAGRRE